MLLREGRQSPPFGRPDWLYEIKYDGYRLLAGVDNGTAFLRTHGGANASGWFPEIAESLRTLPGGPHVLDGEVTCLDDIGRSDFDRLRARARRRKRFAGCDPVVYCVFDLLARNGRDIRGLPLEERKAMLRELLTPNLPGVLFVGHFDAEHGAQLYSQAMALKLEGLVAKRKGSVYASATRSNDWLKIKVPGAVPPQRFSTRQRHLR